MISAPGDIAASSCFEMVGATGIEPVTPTMSRKDVGLSPDIERQGIAGFPAF